MELKPLALTHLVGSPRVESAAPPLLILLHGYGANERDLFTLAPYLDPRLLIISVRAPFVMWPDSYAWFQLTETPRGFSYDAQQAQKSVLLALSFIAAAIPAYNADPARVYVLGFSQGAAIGAAGALLRPDLIAGTILASGVFPAEALALITTPERLAGKPFLMTHGTADPVIPIEHARAGRDMLAALPVELTYREYPGGHEITAACLADITTWLSARLDEGV